MVYRYHTNRTPLAAAVHYDYAMRSGCLSHANRRTRESRPHRRPRESGM